MKVRLRVYGLSNRVMQILSCFEGTIFIPDHNLSMVTLLCWKIVVPAVDWSNEHTQPTTVFHQQDLCFKLLG